MKIIFLDIDGVLNSRQWIEKLGGTFGSPDNQMDPDAVNRLNQITDATGAKIVVSSTWRLLFYYEADALDKLKRCLLTYGITGEVIDMTTDKCDVVRNQRGKEIQQWLDNNQEVESFVIVDDDSDMGELLKHLVKTKFDDGLLDKHVKTIISKLGT